MSIQSVKERIKLPHIVAILAFIVLPLLYCFPVLDGKKLQQGDIIKFTGMSRETKDFRQTEDDEPLWTGTAFSGMTTFFVGTNYSSNWPNKIRTAILNILPNPVGYIFLLALGMWILLLSLRVDPWWAILGALAFALSSNMLISLEAGHTTKTLSIAFMPGIIAGMVLAFRGKWLLSFVLTAFFVTFQIASGHFQIIYYTALLTLFVGVAYLIKAIKDQTILPYFKAVGVLLAALAVGALPNFGKLYNVNEHARLTMRGDKGELTSADSNSTGGLSFNYALDQWSYGTSETGTLMQPFFAGGASNEEVSSSTTYGEFMKSTGNIGRKDDTVIAPLYFGPQTFTSPIYLGASVIFLFLLGLLLVKGYARWWMLAGAIFFLMLSWGSHFGVLNEFLFYKFPLFNKFRNPTMALAIPGMVTVALGMMALSRYTLKGVPIEDKLKYLKWSLAGAGILLLLIVMHGLTSDFTAGEGDVRTLKMLGDIDMSNPQQASFATQFLDAVKETRIHYYWLFTLRSFIVIALVGGLMWLYLKQKIAWKILFGGIALVILFDVVLISRRYLDSDSFVSPREFQAQLRATDADTYVKQDTDPHYRVLDFTRGLFSDGYTPYHHKSILGYSPAKIRIYQDLIENELGNEVQSVGSVVKTANSEQALKAAFRSRLPVINMLNTKYLILGQQRNAVLQNQAALGNAWFVSRLEVKPNADAVMESLSGFNPESTALIQEKNLDGLQTTYTLDSAATIDLTQYKANELKYKSRNSNPGLAVFSEVYYPDGWKAYVDGQEMPIHKVNYALRAIEIPAGEHDIRMYFRPESWSFGQSISQIGSIIFFLLVFGGIVWLIFGDQLLPNNNMKTEFEGVVK